MISFTLSSASTFANGSMNADLWRHDIQKWSGIVPNVWHHCIGAAAEIWCSTVRGAGLMRSPGMYTVLYHSSALQCTYKEDEHRGENLLKVCIKSVTEDNNCGTIEWRASPVF